MAVPWRDRVKKSAAKAAEQAMKRRNQERKIRLSKKAKSGKAAQS